MSERPNVIAVVDDEASVCRAFERLMRSAGFEVVTFTSGAEFLEFVESGKVGCAILDLHMPGLGGVELLLRLRAAGRAVPVVIVTGHDSPESHKRAMDAGAIAYLRKPADDEALVAAVNTGIRSNAA